MRGSSMLALILLLCSNTTKAESLLERIHNPPSNGTLVEEIQCYAIPNGGIGFASHIITYYTIAALYYQRRPYMPWKRSTHGTLDIVLAIFSLILTIITSTLTMVRCRHRWEFVAIGAWKLGLSLTLGCLSVHAAVRVGKEEEPDLSSRNNLDSWLAPNETMGRTGARILWLLVYIPGLIAGLTGLISLVHETIGSNHDVKVITGVFGGVIGFLGLVTLPTMGTAIPDCDCDDDDDALYWVMVWYLGKLVLASLPWLGFFGVLWSDWVLAAIAGNLAGSPSSDNAALYWTYFVAKRLPFFSS